MSYNQKPPGQGGSGMSGGPPNGPNNSQQVAKTIAGIQQQMQSLVHGQNALPQTPQADLNAFLHQQRFQNIFKQQQQQLLQFQQQMQQQHQQNKDHAGSSGEPLALTRTPAAAELLSKTYQQHHQQQPNGSSTNPNSAINQFQQQLQALQPNLMQQLQAFQMQMQQQQQQQQQHFPQATPQTQHHAQQQQPQAQLPISQQQLHGQNQAHQQQQKALSAAAAVQQFQNLQQRYLSAVTAQSAVQQTGANKMCATPPPPPPLTNQIKPPNLPPSTQITPVMANSAGNVGGGSLSSGPIAKNTSNIPATAGTLKQVAPSISLLPAKQVSTSSTPAAAHQQNKFNAGKSSPIVSAIPPPFPSHLQKPSNTNVAPVAACTAKTGTNPDTTAALKSPQRSPVPLTKQPTGTTLSSSSTSGSTGNLMKSSTDGLSQLPTETANTSQAAQPKVTSTLTSDQASSNKNLKTAQSTGANSNNNSETEHTVTNITEVEPAPKETNNLKANDDGKTQIVQKPTSSEVNDKTTVESANKNSNDSLEHKDLKTIENVSTNDDKDGLSTKHKENDKKDKRNEIAEKIIVDAPIKAKPSVTSNETETTESISETSVKLSEEKKDTKTQEIPAVNIQDEINAANKKLPPEASADDVQTNTKMEKVDTDPSLHTESVKIDTVTKQKEVEQINEESKNDKVKKISESDSNTNSHKDVKLNKEKSEVQTSINDSAETSKTSTKTNENSGLSSETKTVKKPLRQVKTVKINSATTGEKTPEKGEKASGSRTAREEKRKSKQDTLQSDDNTLSATPSTPVEPNNTPRDRKSQRHRLKTILYQSPLPELAYITKLSASEASNSPKPMSVEDRLIVFYKNEYMAVRNAEGTFYLCQTMQNVYRTSPRISIRWLSEDSKDTSVYIPDFYDHTDIECVLTTVELKRLDKGHLRLPKAERSRIESILKKAIDVEKGLVPRPELSIENPDGLDISLYKDESQIEKKAAGVSTTITSVRKSKRSGNLTDSPSEVSTPATGSKRKHSTAGTSPANSRKSSAKKRKSATKRKKKTKGSSDEDNDAETSDESPSDKEYKPSQKKSNVSASKSSPRAQRSPLAKARAASPITPTTSRPKFAPPKNAPSSRSERAIKRKSGTEETIENVTPAKKTTTNTKSVNSKNKQHDNETDTKSKNSTNDATSPSTKPHSPVASTSTPHSSGHNRPTRSRK